MRTIPNWRGEPIEVASSRGGVLAVVNPKHNLMLTASSTPWPPPEILQKLCQSRRQDAFTGPDLAAVTDALGFYSDLQSLNSEDAMTWSVFGTLAYAESTTRCTFVLALFNLLNIPIDKVAHANVWLWRRIPHPDTSGLGGPEIDFGIETEQAVLLGEAKWLSRVGQAQGEKRDKDQITLRREFFEKCGNRVFGPIPHCIVLGVSLQGHILQAGDVPLEYATLHLRDTTWDAVCNIESHPARCELISYLEWKKQHSKKSG